jgi:hypothetical protein
MNIATTERLRAALNANGDLIAKGDLTLAAGLDWTGVRNIRAGGNISAGDAISAGGYIHARGTIHAGGTIRADRYISAFDAIHAGGTIHADRYISAGDAIHAGGTIHAGDTIHAGGTISAGGTVRAYTAQYTNEPPISEQVARLDAVRAAALDDPAALNMTTWHKCETTHCIAGWLQVQAGLPQNSEYAARDAARLAPIASGLFHASTARALAWLKDREYAQEETR